MNFLYQSVFVQYLGYLLHTAVATTKQGQDIDGQEGLDLSRHSFSGFAQPGNTAFEEITLYNSTSKKLRCALDDIPDGVRFPPGHPLPAGIYREHPFRERMYYPGESYDRVLFEERESELIKLLVNLGATKIIIEERNVAEDSASSTLGAQATVLATADYQQSKREKGFDSRSRTIDLGPRRNFRASNLQAVEKDHKAYRWLDWEPSWQSLLYARVFGHCLSSEVELSFSKDTMALTAGALGFDLAKLGIPTPIANVGVELQREIKDLFETKLLFRVWFAEVPES